MICFLRKLLTEVHCTKYCIWNFDHVPKDTASTKESLNTDICYFRNMQQNFPIIWHKTIQRF